MSAPIPLTVELCTAASAFTELQAEWEALLACCAGATVYQSPTWNRIWWSHHAGENKLALLVVREQRRLVGLGPFMTRRGWGCRRVYPIGHGEYAYFGPLILPGREDVAEVMAEGLAERFPRALVHVPYFQEHQTAMDLMMKHLCARGWRARSWMRDTSHILYEEGGYEAYLAGRSGKTRKNLKQEHRKLEAAGRLEVEHREGSLVDGEVLDRIAKLQARSWLSRRGQLSLNTPYVRDLIPALAAEGRAEVYLMTLDGRDMAYLLSYRQGGDNVAVFTGFDEDLAHLSPGKALWNCVVQTMLDRGDRSLDFQFGDAEYKRFWANRSQEAREVVVWRGLLPGLHAWFPARLRQEIKQHPQLRKTLKAVRAKMRGAANTR